MAINGVIPKCLVDFPLPVCAACLYVKETKLPCKTKTEISINENRLVASVGDCVSVNVLVSSTPDVIM